MEQDHSSVKSFLGGIFCLFSGQHPPKTLIQEPVPPPTTGDIASIPSQEIAEAAAYAYTTDSPQSDHSLNEDSHPSLPTSSLNCHYAFIQQKASLAKQIEDLKTPTVSQIQPSSWHGRLSAKSDRRTASIEMLLKADGAEIQNKSALSARRPTLVNLTNIKAEADCPRSASRNQSNLLKVPNMCNQLLLKPILQSQNRHQYNHLLDITMHSQHSTAVSHLTIQKKQPI